MLKLQYYPWPIINDLQLLLEYKSFNILDRNSNLKLCDGNLERCDNQHFVLSYYYIVLGCVFIQNSKRFLDSFETDQG